MNNLITIENVRGYLDETTGTAYLNAEDVARGFGFTEEKNGVEYVKWRRVNAYLKEFGYFATSGESNLSDSFPVWKDDYLPENMVYRLGFKANNEVAQKFQAVLADEVIPSIRKTGGYISGAERLTDAEIMAKALLVAQKTIEEKQGRINHLEIANSELTVNNRIMSPKAEYFDELVDRNLLTNIRTTAKELKVQEKAFVKFLITHKYLYRDGTGKLTPYADKNDGLFEIKESYNEKTAWRGTQTLITPKGRETFRLLCEGLKGA